LRDLLQPNGGFALQTNFNIRRDFDIRDDAIGAISHEYHDL
jgi:hypothetical protein